MLDGGREGDGGCTLGGRHEIDDSRENEDGKFLDEGLEGEGVDELDG